MNRSDDGTLAPPFPPVAAPIPPLVPAGASDLADVEALLRAAGLTIDGLGACVADRSVVICREHGGCILGVAATERFGTTALLRSVAVLEPARGRGLGRALVSRALADARAGGAREAWLLTETAETFFAGLGWERADRSEAPAEIAASVEFASACPASAIAMRRTL